MGAVHPGHTYALRAWYGWMGETISSPKGPWGLGTALPEEAPRQEGEGDRHEPHDEGDVEGRGAPLAERVEAHGRMVGGVGAAVVTS